MAIVGAGAYGCSLAYHLASTGTEVALIDAHGVASQTSLRAAGMTGAIHSKKDMTLIAQRSIEKLMSFTEETGEPLDVHQNGSVWLARGLDTGEALASQMEHAARLGVVMQEIAPEEAARRAPFLRDDGITRAAFVPSDAYVEAGELVNGYARAAARRGAAVHPGVKVTEITVRRGKVVGVKTQSGTISAGHVVIAAGAWSTQVAAMAGIRLPLVPVRHQLMITEPFPGSSPDHVSLRFRDQRVYVRPCYGGLMLGGYEPVPQIVDPAVQPEGFTVADMTWDESVMIDIADSVSGSIPLLRRLAVHHHRGGLPTMTPDNRPILGPVPGIDRLYVASGCCVAGLSTSPAVGEIIAGAITGASGDPLDFGADHGAVRGEIHIGGGTARGVRRLVRRVLRCPARRQARRSEGAEAGMRDPAGGTSGIPWRSLATAIVMIALSTQPVFLTGAVFLQLGEEIGLTPSGLGFLVAGFFLTASLASTPMGHVVARIGWRPAMTVNSVVSGACLLAIALWADSVVTMGVILVVAGAAYGMTNPAANGALAEQARRDRLGVVFGLKHAGIPTSSLIAGLAVPLIVINFGWRWAFAGSLVLIPLSLFLIHTGIGTDRSQNGSVQVEPPSPARLSTARLAWIALALAFSTSSAIYLTTFLVGAAVEAQLSEAQAGLLLFAGVGGDDRGSLDRRCGGRSHRQPRVCIRVGTHGDRRHRFSGLGDGDRTLVCSPGDRRIRHRMGVARCRHVHRCQRQCRHSRSVVSCRPDRDLCRSGAWSHPHWRARRKLVLRGGLVCARGATRGCGSHIWTGRKDEAAHSVELELSLQPFHTPSPFAFEEDRVSPRVAHHDVSSETNLESGSDRRKRTPDSLHW